MQNPTTTPDQAGSSAAFRLQEGEDWVCPNCGCEIRVRHAGDPSRMQRTQPVTCCCGTPMEHEQRG
jgi:hypothetical protein